MTDLSVSYMGMLLKNPLIIGSSTLTDSADKIKILEQHGAGAVVLKSLNEEEIRGEDNGCNCTYHPEAYNYDVFDAAMIYGISNYINLIKDCKSSVKIPVIASLNCNDGKWWMDYPRQIEDAGADAIELNITHLSFDANTPPEIVSANHLEIIETVRKRISIPMSVKLSPYSCSIPFMANQMQAAGANAIVMFSRFFKVGIDLDTFQCMPVNYYSSEIETYKSLRWVGIIHKQLKDFDICSNTGIHSAHEALQHIIAGAKAFEMVSSIYKNGPEVISKTLKEISNWMIKKEFYSLDEVRGLVSKPATESAFHQIHYNSVIEENIR